MAQLNDTIVNGDLVISKNGNNLNVMEDLSLKTVEGTNLTVTYNKYIVEIEGTILNYSANAGNSDNTTARLPSNIVPYADLYSTCMSLNSGWRPNGLLYVAFCKDGTTEIRTSNDISNGVVIIHEIYSRSMFNIS